MYPASNPAFLFSVLVFTFECASDLEEISQSLPPPLFAFTDSSPVVCCRKSTRVASIGKGQYILWEEATHLSNPTVWLPS